MKSASAGVFDPDRKAQQTIPTTKVDESEMKKINTATVCDYYN
jgi:hypothetical protein